MVRRNLRAKDDLLVLVVDDFEDARELYGEYLTFLGYHVIKASDGDEAVQVARREKPDVVIMDLAMPVLDGWQAVRELRRSSETADAAIIALSGHDSPPNRKLALDSGADAFVAKPCLPDDLDRAIVDVLRRRGR